ncbi:hypothetical protein HW130_06075 [Streptomyces sp. PKU-EA00015]|uniref:hypothetical protein n=1 Tax=Streptomyces sp. PKU-EA00015 TaxID=2748326 RepID=UPI0015A059F1|nr:hypothetical protein [Streptomyces sp. PKU-EA00015]NWF25835.1 hypothetical protein [Streptomyces sp. PKU-EA00015]
MDLESILDELYGLRPQDFTAARNARAAEARRAGDPRLAERIKALRRPTVSAWAGNLLVRRDPERVRPLLALGEGLRSAHRGLNGEQLRELSRQQHLLVSALAREARDLAAAEGQQVGESALREIEGTLHAVLADPAAAEEWAAGHLDRPLTPPVGFTAAVADPGVVANRAPAPRPGGRPQAEGPERAAEPLGRERRAERDEARRAEQEQARRKAREQAASAEEEARDREAEHARAAAESERADAQADEAAERVDVLTEELKEARSNLRAAEKEARRARDRARAADVAASSARHRARQASQNVGRPTSDRE